MPHWTRISVIVVLAVAAAVYGWRWAFPDDAAQIGAVLERMATIVEGADRDDQVGRLARAARLGRELAPDVQVDAGPPFRALRGRDAVMAAVSRLPTMARQLEIRFPDKSITVAPDRHSAVAMVTAEARFIAANGERGIDARELEIAFTRLDGQWVVAGVTHLEALQRPDEP